MVRAEKEPVTLSEARGRSSIQAQAPSVATLPQGDSGVWNLWIDHQARPGWANMAIDQTLLDRAEQQGESWLRLYSWQPHCLSFGRHEPAVRRYDGDRIAELGIDTVRRPTGGRAVWHARELTYAVAAPSRLFGSLQAAYLEIHRMLGDALARHGVTVSLAPPSRAAALDAGPCFAQPAGGEVMVGGRKVVGSAQLRQGSALLQHGSILLEDDQHTVHELTRYRVEGSPSRVTQSRASSALLDRPLPAADLAHAIAAAAAARWSGCWSRTHDPDEVLCAASGHYPQFRSAAWTWAR